MLTRCSSTGRVGCEVIESPFCHGEDAEEEEEAEVPKPRWNEIVDFSRSEFCRLGRLGGVFSFLDC